MTSEPGRGLRATCKAHHFIALKPAGHGLLRCALQKGDHRSFARSFARSLSACLSLFLYFKSGLPAKYAAFSAIVFALYSSLAMASRDAGAESAPNHKHTSAASIFLAVAESVRSSVASAPACKPGSRAGRNPPALTA